MAQARTKAKPPKTNGHGGEYVHEPDGLEEVLRGEDEVDPNERAFLKPEENVDLFSDVPDRMLVPLLRVRWLARRLGRNGKPSPVIDEIVTDFLRLSVSRNRGSRREWSDIQTARSLRTKIVEDLAGGGKIL